MSKLNYSTRLFAGAIVYFAEYGAATSDATTLPVVGSALWKEIGAVQSLTHKPTLVEEKVDEVGAGGWVENKDVYSVADLFELKTKEVSELVHRLAFGTAAVMVSGTAQTPFANPVRKVTGWIKIQQRQNSTGTDRSRMDIYCDIRLQSEPAIEKKIQEPTLELYVLSSTLSSVVIPS